MLKVFSADVEDECDNEVALVLPSFAEIDYAHFLQSVQKSPSLGSLSPVWQPGHWGGGVLAFLDCAGGIRSLDEALRTIAMTAALNKMGGTSLGNDEGLDVSARVWKISTEIGSSCEQIDATCVRHSNVRVTIEHCSHWLNGIYTVLIESRRRKQQDDLIQELNHGLQDFGYRVMSPEESKGLSTAPGLQFIDCDPLVECSFVAPDDYTAVRTLAQAWYVAEHLDLAISPLTDFVVVGRFTPEVNYREFWTNRTGHR